MSGTLSERLGGLCGECPYNKDKRNQLGLEVAALELELAQARSDKESMAGIIRGKSGLIKRGKERYAAMISRRDFAVAERDMAIAQRDAAIVGQPGRPRITCLCGSTRFAAAFWDLGWELTLQGVIVLTINVVRWCEDHAGERLGPEVCDLLDSLHLCKIDQADDITVINLGGYIGESTSVEVSYAHYLGKPINYLED